MKMYNDSLLKLLATVYPDHSWRSTRQAQPSHYWDDLSNQRKFVDWMADQFKIEDKSDWYKIKTKVS